MNDAVSEIKRKIGAMAVSGGNVSEMTSEPRAIPEFFDVDIERFRRDILSQYRPAVLRGAVAAWPAVIEGRRRKSTDGLSWISR